MPFSQDPYAPTRPAQEYDRAVLPVARLRRLGLDEHDIAVLQAGFEELTEPARLAVVEDLAVKTDDEIIGWVVARYDAGL